MLALPLSSGPSYIRAKPESEEEERTSNTITVATPSITLVLDSGAVFCAKMVQRPSVTTVS